MDESGAAGGRRSTDVTGAVRRSEWERLVQMGVAAVLTIVLGLGVNTLTETSRAVATQGVKIDALADQIADLKGASKGAYTAAEAAKDLGRLEGRIGDLEQRVRVLEANRPGGAR